MGLMHDDEFPAMLEREAGLPDYVNPVAVAFGLHYEIDPKATATAGHEVYRDVIFVKIAVPGDKNSLYFQPATDKHKERFPRAWEAFQARSRGAAGRVGMPIENWAPISRAMALTLKASHIHTVEDLAVVHDGQIDKIGGDGRGLRAKAQAFLAQAKDSAETIRLAAEKEELKGQLAAMQEMIHALQAAAGAATGDAQTQAVIAKPAEDPEKVAMREQMDTLQKQMAQLLSMQQQAPAAAPPSADNPAAARRPRTSFQRKQEDASA